MHSENREDIVKETIKITTIGIVVNLILSALKFVVGMVGHSQSVIADAIHSLSDSVTDFAVIFGVRFWSAPPDENHPYGHQRIEALITLFIGVMIGLTAILLLVHTLTGDGEKSQTGWIALWGPALSIVAKEILFWMTIGVGKKINSSALISNAWHHRSDAISSIPALIAVIITALKPEWQFVDQLGALIIAGFIFKVAYEIIKPALMELTDSTIPQEELEKLGEIVLSVEGVRNYHALRTRQSGPYHFVDLHIQVCPSITVKEGHDIASEVREVLITEGNQIAEVIVHTEPDE